MANASVPVYLPTQLVLGPNLHVTFLNYTHFKGKVWVKAICPRDYVLHPHTPLLDTINSNDFHKTLSTNHTIWQLCPIYK